MSTHSVEPLSKEVKAAVRRHRSPVRRAMPAAIKVFHFFMLVAIVGGALFGVVALWRAAMRDSRFQIKGDLLGLDGTVRQCPEALPELSGIGAAFNGRILLDPLHVSDLEKDYSGSVWVRRVTHLRRSFPNRINLELELRLPAAQVASGGKYYLVDVDGVLLPVAGQKQPFTRLPEIVGVTGRTIAGRPDKPGGIWRDEGVTGGLGVMRAFWGSPLSEALPVARVVVNTGVFKSEDGVGREIRRRFEVVTTTGAVIRWGTYNPALQGDELTSAEKMYNLEMLLRSEDALRPGVCFDVRTRLPGFSLLE
ncbi:MAG: hypothetical protein LUC93_07025 [Planctomycetaceae bacterium]|nr:hypothetical protein [Planctomycetaceae bacterium]